jgi:hypothetical protein
MTDLLKTFPERLSSQIDLQDLEIAPSQIWGAVRLVDDGLNKPTFLGS